MLSRALWLAPALFAVVASQAAAQDFPSSFEPSLLSSWIKKATSLSPDDIVSVGSTDIIALKSVVPEVDSPEIRKVEFHAEVVSARLAEAEGYRSWLGALQVNCASGEVRVVSVQTFPERGLKGQAKLSPASSGWARPAEGTQLGTLVAATCASGFEGPFRALRHSAASAAGETSAPAAGVHGEPAAARLPPPSVPAPAPAMLALVQVGATSSEALALEAAKKAMRLLPENSVARVNLRVEPVRSRGRMLYRAQLVGFEDAAAAGQACSMLKAARQDCLVRTARPDN